MTTAIKKVRKKKLPVEQTAMTKQEKQKWKDTVETAYGCLSWVNYSVDEYLSEKHAETERENTHTFR